MKNGQNSLLQHRPHVDQHVAATDQIQPRERRILAQVVPGKHAAIADGFVDLVVGSHFGEEAPRRFGETPATAASEYVPSLALSSAEVLTSVPKI